MFQTKFPPNGLASWTFELISFQTVLSSSRLGNITNVFVEVHLRSFKLGNIANFFVEVHLRSMPLMAAWLKTLEVPNLGRPSAQSFIIGSRDRIWGPSQLCNRQWFQYTLPMHLYLYYRLIISHGAVEIHVKIGNDKSRTWIFPKPTSPSKSQTRSQVLSPPFFFWMLRGSVFFDCKWRKIKGAVYFSTCTSHAQSGV